MKVRYAAEGDLVRYEGRVYKVDTDSAKCGGAGDVRRTFLCGDEESWEVDPELEVEWMPEGDC